MEKKLSAALVEIIAQFEDQGSVRVMFQDEARFGRISDTRRCWCPKPERPLVKAMVTQEYTYAYAAVSPLDGQLDSLILPHVNGECMQVFLDEVAARYPKERIVMVLDGAGWQPIFLREPQPICLRRTWTVQSRWFKRHLMHSIKARTSHIPHA